MHGSPNAALVAGTLHEAFLRHAADTTCPEVAESHALVVKFGQAPLGVP